ncbi:MAG: hypothetical protein ABI689_13000 [Thermoanaerobaculia bacterium]
MQATLRVLRDLENEGVLERYAIGGAMAATFYCEPLATFDLDVFVILPVTESGLISLAALYAALRQRGYEEEGDCVVIEGIPVQFLPAYNALVEEALREAREQPFEAVSTRVLRAEHLLAIALQTGRPKGRERVRILLEQAEIERPLLTEIVRRHGLEARWSAWTS